MHKNRCFIFVIVFMVFTIFIFGYALRNCEVSFIREIPEKYFQDWTQISNGFWFMTTNILLLGYGDYYPTTILGRIIAFFTMIWGIIFEGFLIKAILKCIKMDSKEEAAFNEIENHLEECNYKKVALKLIYQVYKTNIIIVFIYPKVSISLSYISPNHIENTLIFGIFLFFKISILFIIDSQCGFKEGK